MDTRAAILQKNFEAIHQYGFHATRTDKVVQQMGITKGAFYHYFPDKNALGYAIVDEIIYPMYVQKWADAIKSGMHPIDSICSVIKGLQKHISRENVCLGCPLNNLIQEMSASDEEFRMRLARVIDDQLAILRQIIEKGIENGLIQPAIAPEWLAAFILSGIEGSFAIAKVKNSITAFHAAQNTLIHFLETLKV
jgi:AcrR family transcriptional regulator